MTDQNCPDWVQRTLQKYVGKTAAPSRPNVGRNVQPEIVRIQAVIDVVSKYQIPEGELARLRNKVQDLMNILNAQS